ncbi:MAG TPA: dihydropteroate synthase [Candidatus Baltobacteraceae bacterium]|nr:dihydropteroate synthase [Candidatus Baltobacteraceae bacterium]
MQLNQRAKRGSLRVRGRELPWGERTYVMGIVNVTPDSFSGDGVLAPQDAVAHALAQYQRSSDMLDIGAESTRPGHMPVSEEIECARLLPVIEGTRRLLPEAIISADTYKAEVFRAAHAAGADMLNSVWGLPDSLLAAAAECNAPVVIMHNKREARYSGSVMDEVLAFLEEAARRALRAGIPQAHVILDPGIGFGKTPDHNIEVLRELRRLPSLGFPTLVGTSRKSTIGKLTGKKPPLRTHGTSATTALAIAAGIDVVRVHDVDEARDAVSVSDAIVRDWRPADWM